jgi:sugar O-acyltransferase (sialic acid O-acetyltransferase NeuD family)
MREVVIFGAGDIAALASFYFREDHGRRVAAFTVDAAYRQGELFLGCPLVDFETVAEKYPPSDYDFFVALSYTKLNRLRAEKVAAAKRLGYTLISYVSSRATVFSDLTHGENCFILENNVIQPYVRLGANVTLWSGNHIGHHSVIQDDVFIASHVVVSGGVEIGRGCFIGVNATLRDHVSLGRECVIGAGALVLEDQPDYAVVAPGGTARSSVPSTRLRRI